MPNSKSASSKNGLSQLNSHRRRKIRQRVITTYGYFCWLCEGNFEGPFYSLEHWYDMQMTIDHVIPVSKGGTNEIENLRPSHRICNEWRADNEEWCIDELWQYLWRA